MLASNPWRDSSVVELSKNVQPKREVSADFLFFVQLYPMPCKRMDEGCQIEPSLRSHSGYKKKPAFKKQAVSSIEKLRQQLLK